MPHNIKVIVSPIKRIKDRSALTWTIAGDNILRQDFTDPVEALRVALSHRGGAKSVIVRPSFNEEHIKQSLHDPIAGYREWRSFDGSLFKEIHFFVTFGDGTVSMTRLDSELVLPPIPTR